MRYSRQLAGLLSAALLGCLCAVPVRADGSREVLVTNVQELHDALADAQAGDTILVREGDYTENGTKLDKGDVVLERVTATQTQK